MAVALGLGHAQALARCAPAGFGVLREAVWWIDACLSETLPGPTPPLYIPMLDFSDLRNSQYVPVVF
jgi:hypothetical protein